MHETLLSDVGPDFGHVTQKVVLNLLFPIYLLDVLPIESLQDMALTGLLPVFIVGLPSLMHLATCAMVSMDNTTSFPRTLDTMVF